MRHVTFGTLGLAFVGLMGLSISSLVRPPVPFSERGRVLSGDEFKEAMKDLNEAIAPIQPTSKTNAEDLSCLILIRGFLKEYDYIADQSTLRAYAPPPRFGTYQDASSGEFWQRSLALHTLQR